MDARTSLARTNIFWSFGLKAWSGLVYLLIVPLTLSCLGEYKNGVWLTISGLLVWIDNMDIGLGNGLRNKLAAHLAHDEWDEARSTVSSTLLMLVLVIVPISVVLLTLIATMDVYGFFNVEPTLVEDLRPALYVATSLVCTTFIFKFLGNFYMGLQLPAVNTALVVGGQTLALIATYAVYLSGQQSLPLIALANTGAPLLVYLAAYPYTFYNKYPKLRPAIDCFRRSIVKELFDIGIKFFLIQIAGAVIFFTSNLLISKIFNPVLVTPYQIAYRYFSLVLMVFAIVCTPFWAASTDAYERGDLEWIRLSHRRMTRMLLLFALLTVAMILVSPMVYHIWIDLWMGQHVEVPFSLSVCMGIYIFELVWSMSYSYFLNGIGKLHLQIVMTMAAAVAFIPLTYIATHCWHSPMALYIVLIFINLPGLIVNGMQLHRILSQTATGIWNK